MPTKITLPTQKRRRGAPISLDDSPSPPASPPAKKLKATLLPPPLSPITQKSPTAADSNERTDSPLSSKPQPPSQPKNDENEDDDYLSHPLPPSPPPRQTQHPPAQLKSKQELAALRAKSRHFGLTTPLAHTTASGKTSKGLSLLQKMGYIPGTGLGKERAGRTEPLGIVFRGGDKGGIGAGKDDDEEEDVVPTKGTQRGKAKKGGRGDDEVSFFDDEKKLREVDVEGYRRNMRSEREQGRIEREVVKAGGILEELIEKENQEKEEQTEEDAVEKEDGVPVVVSILRKQRKERDEEKKARQMKGETQYVHSISTTDDQSYEEDMGLSKEEGEFMELDVQERLDIVVEELKRRFNYCYWCKYRYEDEEMDGCPGGGEDNHG